MTETDLEKEVKVLIQKRIDKGRVAPATWITQEVVNQHGILSGDDPEWFRYCAFAHIRSVVRRCVQHYRGSPTLETDQQLLLGDEFKRIQKAYLVERKKEQIVVPVNLLSSGEIEGKINELRKMGEGCFEHADELTRYNSRRQAIA